MGIPAVLLFVDVPGVEHVYGFQRDSLTSGYKCSMMNDISRSSISNPAGLSDFRLQVLNRGEEPGLEDLLKKVVSGGTFSN